MRLPRVRPDDAAALERKTQRPRVEVPCWIDPAHDEAWCGQAPPSTEADDGLYRRGEE